MRPKKYSPEKQAWYANDLFTKCTKPVVKCPKCNHHGHVIVHLNQNVRSQGRLQVIKYVQHSHFTHETDRGRHVICEIGRSWVDPENACDVQYRLKGRKDMPDWIKDQLYGLDLDSFC